MLCCHLASKAETVDRTPDIPNTLPTQLPFLRGEVDPLSPSTCFLGPIGVHVTYGVVKVGVRIHDALSAIAEPPCCRAHCCEQTDRQTHARTRKQMFRCYLILQYLAKVIKYLTGATEACQ